MVWPMSNSVPIVRISARASFLTAGPSRRLNNSGNGGPVAAGPLGTVQRLIRRPDQIFDLAHVGSEAGNTEARSKPLATGRPLFIQGVAFYRKADPFRLHPGLSQIGLRKNETEFVPPVSRDNINASRIAS